MKSLNGRIGSRLASCSLLAAVIAAVAATGGCETMPGPTPTRIETVDYGSFPDDYETLAVDWVHERTGEAYAVADLQVTEPERGWYRAPVALRGVTTYGYKSFVSFSMQAQPGDRLTRHRYLVLFRDGRIALARPADELMYLGDDG